jgi:hypothetical protein
MVAHDNLSSQQFWHITDNPKFALDPKYEPENNTTLGGRMKPGIFLGRSAESWVNGHNYIRPYVAEIHAHPDIHEQSGVHGGYSGETFVPAEHFDKLKVHRVIPLDANAREEYGASGWIEQYHGTRFEDDKPLPKQFGNVYPYRYSDPYKAHSDYKTLPEQPYKYSGPDVRDMNPAEHERHASRARAFLEARLAEKGEEY